MHIGHRDKLARRHFRKDIVEIVAVGADRRRWRKEGHAGEDIPVGGGIGPAQDRGDFGGAALGFLQADDVGAGGLDRFDHLGEIHLIATEENVEGHHLQAERRFGSDGHSRQHRQHQEHGQTPQPIEHAPPPPAFLKSGECLGIIK